MRKKRLGKKASVTMYLAFFVLAVVIILVTALVAPFGVLFTAEMIQAGEDVLAQANESIQNINDATIRAAVQADIDAAFSAAEQNIEVNTSLFQYAWVLVVILAGVMAFLFTRRTVEFGGPGSGFV